METSPTITKNPIISLIEKSGVEKEKQEILISKFSDYISISEEWKKKAEAIKVTDASQLTEMGQAREGRLILAKKRNEIEKTRKAMKEESLKEGRAIDTIAKELTALIQPIEDYLSEQENFAVLLESKRKDEVALLREKELQPYSEFLPLGINLRNAGEEDYQKILNGAKLQMQNKIDREAKDKADYEAHLKAEAEEKERMKKELEEKEKQLADERAKAEAERKQAQEKADKLKAEADAKLKAEREANERLQAEIRAKAEAEEKAKQEAEAKNEMELSKGDAEKMADFIFQLGELKTKYSFKSKKFQTLYKSGIELIDKTISYLQTKK